MGGATNMKTAPDFLIEDTKPRRTVSCFQFGVVSALLLQIAPPARPKQSQGKRTFDVTYRQSGDNSYGER
jgi:hypothetical protein